MLRLRAWLFFSVLLLIGVLVVGTAPSFQACLKQGALQAAPAAAAAPQAHGTTVLVAQSMRECLGRFYTENRDDIIAGIALILLLSTIFLWFSSRDLVASTHDFAKMQLRAYLGPSETFITGVAVGEKPVVECTIRNFGQTPAHRMSYWADCRLLDSMSHSFDRGPPQGGERTVNPGRDGFTIKSRLPEPLTEEEMSKIKLGTSAIYFFGAITYRDAFSRNRKTQFRFQHGGSRVFGTEDMTLSPKGNRAT
jgi:hypothetical protein